MWGVCRRYATEDSWVAGHSSVRVAAQEGTECLAIFQDIFGRSFLARLRVVKGQSPHKMLAMLMEAHDRGQLTRAKKCGAKYTILTPQAVSGSVRET